MAGLPFRLLLLADGRLPAGGHVHSGGVEQAIDTGRVDDLGSLAAWLVARTVTIGAVEATLAAAAVIAAGTARVPAAAETGATAATGAAEADGRRGRRAPEGQGPDWELLTWEAEARSPVPALRVASRARGRALVRVAMAAFDDFDADALPAPARDPGWPLPIATGAIVASLGFAPVDAAMLILHGGVAEPAQASVRRLGLDPVGITRLLARLEPTIAATAELAVSAAAGEPASWPSSATPHFDLAAATHADRGDRYFAT